MTQSDKTSSFDMIKILKAIASVKVTVVCLIILTVIVVWGTVYQAEYGLYQAQQKFFHSWIFLIFGVIPFPGTVLVLFALFFNLVCSLFFRIGFKWSNIGNIITHTGILVLLVGGFFTFYFSEESTLMLKEGETASMSTARGVWELAAWEQNSVEIFAVDTSGLPEGERIDLPELDLNLYITMYHENCTAHDAKPGTADTGPIFNSAGNRHLQGRRAFTEKPDNIPGMIFDIETAAGVAGKVLLYGGDNQPTMVDVDNRIVFFSLGRKKIPLPLTMTLKDFKVEFYPNSNIPKSYESSVSILAEGGVERDVKISMNKPLRFKNLAFFQSSYIIGRDGNEYTILAVVKNVGRLLPYIASLWIFLGLLVHFIVKLMKRRKKP